MADEAGRKDKDRMQQGKARAGRRDGWGPAVLLALLFVAIPLWIAQQQPAAVTSEFGTGDEPPAGTAGLNTGAEQSPEGPFRWGGAQVDLDLLNLGYPLETDLHV